jgi:iron complex transport system substrate-binding protein
MRAVSLVPAATEIAAALGLLDRIAAASHECDWPPEARALPRATACTVADPALPSAEVDRRVRESLAAGGTLYSLDEALLRRLAPEVILTQAVCAVCAPGYGSVEEFARTLPGPPAVLGLDPDSLQEVFLDVRRVAAALGAPERADRLLRVLATRVDAVRRAVAGRPRPRCLVLEWADPPYATGHWGPDLVDAAGGEEVLGRAGEDSRRISGEEIAAAAPEVVVLALCGYPVERALEDVPILRARPEWGALPAVRSGRVFAVDGSAFFSRPGPRLVDSIEILAGILHPDRFAIPVPGDSVRRVT